MYILLIDEKRKTITISGYFRMLNAMYVKTLKCCNGGEIRFSEIIKLNE